MQKLRVVIKPKLRPRSAPKARVVNPAPQMVDTIIIKPQSKHPALTQLANFRVVHSFSELSLRSDVVAALEGSGVNQPTVIQMLAIPKIARGKNVLIASETGSGKTLTYLAPLISRLRDEEEGCGLVPRLRRPRALILLPSRDLAAQVLSVAKSLCHTARFRAVGLIGGVKRKFIKDALHHPVDLAVATPSSLLRYQKEERLWLSDLSHLVIDEADTLFDRSFIEDTLKVIKTIKLRSKKPSAAPVISEDAQVTVVGATLSQPVVKKIESLVPNLKKVSTKHVHQILPNIQQTFIRTAQNEKAEKLVSLIEDYPKDVFMVFCNTVSSCDWTSRYLKEHNVPVVKLHGGFAPQDRRHLLRDFSEGSARVLVSTDIASRGIDSTSVNHVVQFDFPTNLPDYLHRVGRTGRVGSLANNCRATAFMTHRRDIRMAWKIKDAADRQADVLDSKSLQADTQILLPRKQYKLPAVG